MKRYNLILFDLDGTTLNTDEMLIEAMYKLYDLYREGKRSPYEKVIYFSGPPIEDTLKNEFPHMDQKFMQKEFSRIFGDLYETRMKEYPYCRETLIKLKEKGYKIGVVTNKNKEGTDKSLRIIGYDKLFDVIITMSDVIHPKPHQEGILKAMDEMKEKDNRKVLYVGDNALDDECAKNAHVDSLIVSWGPRALPKDLKPTYFLDSYQNFLEVIEHE